MSRPIVYLAGAIAGLSGKEATDWRSQAARQLWSVGVETLDPMRGKANLASAPVVATDFREYEKHGAFFTSRGIMARDFNDVKRCDALLVNLLGLTWPSKGTIMEIAWAYALQKPTIVAMEAEGNPHDGHPMIHEAISFRFDSIQDAISAVAVVVNR